MFSHVKSVGCIFSLFLRISNFGLVGRLTCFLDSNSRALKVQRVASLKCSVWVR